MAEPSASIDYQQLYKEVAQKGWGSHSHVKGTCTISSGIVTFTRRLSALAQGWAANGFLQLGTDFYDVNTYDSATQVTLTDTSVNQATAAGFVLTQAPEETWERVRDVIDGGLRNFYNHKQWRFLEPGTTIATVASYSTGTVTVASGIATFSAALPATEQGWAADGDLTIDGTEYSINTYDSTTQVTLDDLTVNAAAGTKFTLSQSLYDLPDDYADMRSPLTHVAGNSESYPQLDHVDESMIWRGRQRRSYTERPRQFAVRVKAHDPTVGERYEIIFGPALPDAIYTFRYNYARLINELTPANRYPPGGMKHAEALRTACLAQMEAEVEKQPGIWTQRFAADLIASARKDNEEAPDHLGYNGDPGSDRHRTRHDQPWYGSSTYEGHILT